MERIYPPILLVTLPTVRFIWVGSLDYLRNMQSVSLIHIIRTLSLLIQSQGQYPFGSTRYTKKSTLVLPRHLTLTEKRLPCIARFNTQWSEI